VIIDASCRLAQKGALCRNFTLLVCALPATLFPSFCKLAVVAALLHELSMVPVKPSHLH
jgi:hypothetical protein